MECPQESLGNYKRRNKILESIITSVTELGGFVSGYRHQTECPIQPILVLPVDMFEFVAEEGYAHVTRVSDEGCWRHRNTSKL